MPIIHPTPTSPPPEKATMSQTAPSPPPAANNNNNNPSTSHQVGTRQATRSRTRRTQTSLANSAGPSRAGVSSLAQYKSEDHPLNPQKLASKGFHSFECLGIPFHVKERYTFIRELGIGAYGCVALARDELLDCNVAIKKVTRIFDRDVLARRALREVAILRHIGPCDNVTALLDFDATFIEFNEIYLILEASEADLSQIIRSGQALSDAHLQYFVAQLLRGLRYMHAANVIHRDLKPGNLLVNADCQLKLCDFGLARAYAGRKEEESAQGAEPPTEVPLNEGPSNRNFPDSPKDAFADLPSSSPERAEESEERKAREQQLHTTALDFPGGPLTEYVATRWYRAPEIMLCFRKGYGDEIDLWSVGCIIAELLGGKPIFAGKDYVDQIARINNILGSPSAATIAKIGSERAKTYVKSLPKMPAVPFAKLYPSASPAAIDLLSKLICWDPSDRISAKEALDHPWLKAYHKSNKNWTSPAPFHRFKEVELLKTIGDFRLGLEKEADEMTAEIEALQAEEEEALGNVPFHQDNSSSTVGKPGGGDAADHKRESQVKDGGQTMDPTGTVKEMMRAGSSPEASPVVTPSPLATSDDDGASPTYETDLTSASAPHSTNGSNQGAATKGERSGRSRVMDGLGLIQSNLHHEEQERRAIDATLASHGLLSRNDYDEEGKEQQGHGPRGHPRSTFRRRALTNAPSRLIALKRVGSEGNLRSTLGDHTGTHHRHHHHRQQGKEEEQYEAEVEGVKTMDIIQRSPLHREEHLQVSDSTESLDEWLVQSSAKWVHGGHHRLAHSRRAIDSALDSREGSDTTTMA